MSIFSELKRRNVFRVAATYVVSAWLLIEIGNTLEDTLNLPDWADTFVAFILIIGFPVVVFFSWAYEITPDGIKREKDIAADDVSRSVTASKLNRALVVIMAIALGYFAVDKFVFTGEPVATEPRPTAEAVSEPGEAVAEEIGSAGPVIPEKSIAVLPFVNMSSDPEQEYFSDGLTEELLNLLAGMEGLQVAARTSSFFYKNKLEEIPLRDVAQQLEVAHILEGSVRKGGDTIRITAQLIKADDGFHLWSETYDRTLDDIFAIQDEIAAAVVKQLEVTLMGETPHQRVIDPQSYQLALEGRFLYNRRNPGDLDRAFELFEQATDLDPDNTIAWIGLSPLYIWMFDPPRAETALAAANRALELDPENPEAHARKALALVFLGRPEAEIDAAVEKSLELGHNNPLILAQQAGRLISKGEIDEGLDWQRRALAADPLNLINVSNMGSYLLQFGRVAEAVPYADKLSRLSPASAGAADLSAAIALQQGRPEETLALVESMPPRELRTSSDNNTLAMKIMAHHDLGHDDQAERMLSEYIASEQERLGDYPFWPAINTAAIYAYLGETDQAFEWIERALAVRLLGDNGPPPVQPFLDWRFHAFYDDARWQRVRDLFPDFQGWDEVRR